MVRGIPHVKNMEFRKKKCDWEVAKVKGEIPKSPKRASGAIRTKTAQIRTMEPMSVAKR